MVGCVFSNSFKRIGAKHEERGSEHEVAYRMANGLEIRPNDRWHNSGH